MGKIVKKLRIDEILTGDLLNMEDAYLCNTCNRKDRSESSSHGLALGLIQRPSVRTEESNEFKTTHFLLKMNLRLANTMTKYIQVKC
jgi:hypothetical protein